MLIGRKPEIKRLEKIYRSKEAEFVVLYGRRRIGKTFLIRKFFESKNNIFFQVTGVQKGSFKKQFYYVLCALGKRERGVLYYSKR